LLTATCVILASLAPVLILHRFGEEGKLVRDSSLALHFFFGLFVAGYAASSALAGERSAGTASLALSKPVSREMFLLAKYSGVLAVVTIFSLAVLLATLLGGRVSEQFVMEGGIMGYLTDVQTARMLLAAPVAAFLSAGLLNYRARRSFQSSAFVLLVVYLAVVMAASGFFDRSGRFAPYSLRIDARVVPAAVLITFALAVLAATALAVSTRAESLPTLTVCFFIFLAGLLSDYLHGRGMIGDTLYRLIPNWQNFWACDALTGGGTIPWSYVARAGFYAATYSAGILCLGALSFRHAELK
jgi:hypothetical protein